MPTVNIEEEFVIQKAIGSVHVPVGAIIEFEPGQEYIVESIEPLLKYTVRKATPPELSTGQEFVYLENEFISCLKFDMASHGIARSINLRQKMLKRKGPK